MNHPKLNQQESSQVLQALTALGLQGHKLLQAHVFESSSYRQYKFLCQDGATCEFLFPNRNGRSLWAKDFMRLAGEANKLGLKTRQSYFSLRATS
jgi:hypothetical protein